MRRAHRRSRSLLAACRGGDAGRGRAAGDVDLAPSGAGDLELRRRPRSCCSARSSPTARPRAAAARGYDLVVTVTGPQQTVVTRRKERVLGIWVNVDSRDLRERAVLSRACSRTARSSRSPMPRSLPAACRSALDNFLLPQRIGAGHRATSVARRSVPRQPSCG